MRFIGQSVKTSHICNTAIDLAPFGHWTLRDKAAQRRSVVPQIL